MRFLPVCYCWHTTPYTPYFWPGPPGCRHDADRTAHRPGPGYAGYRVSGTRSFPAESAMHAVMPRPSFYHLGSRAVCWPWWQGRVLLDRADPECLHGAAGGSYSTIFIPFRVMKHVHTMSLEYIWSVHPPCPTVPSTARGPDDGAPCFLHTSSARRFLLHGHPHTLQRWHLRPPGGEVADATPERAGCTSV